MEVIAIRVRLKDNDSVIVGNLIDFTEKFRTNFTVQDFVSKLDAQDNVILDAEHVVAPV